MGSGPFQTPPRRPGGPPTRRPAPPKAEDYTEQFPAISRNPARQPEPDDQAPVPDEPPAGLANWRKRRHKAAVDDTEIGVMPVSPDEVEAPEPDAGLLDPGPSTRGFPPPQPFAPARATPPDGFVPGGPPSGENLDFDDEANRGHNAAGVDDGYDYDDDLDDYESDLDDYERDLDDDLDDNLEDEREEQGSPAKQWLLLAGQLALGIVGGAAVWLGFNWLWVTLPAAALVVALLVVVALVWIVRKIRRAEDLQTTVLAVLVGLVVTVSPAALLLVSR
jgi:hypothetical protein